MDPRLGLPESVSVGRLSLLDRKSPHAFGALIIESLPNTEDLRSRLAERRGSFDWNVRHPKLRACHRGQSSYAERHLTIWSDPMAHRIEQRWDVFHGEPRIELTTTLWLKDGVHPLAIYLCFPLQLTGAQVFYDSMGIPTQFGTDQMAGTCGEFAAVGGGVQWKSARGTLTLASPDAPLGTMESPATRLGRTAFAPKNQRYYALLANNHWITNFPFLQAAKLTVRHILDFSASGGCEALNGELWAFPSSQKPPRQSVNLPAPQKIRPKPLRQ